MAAFADDILALIAEGDSTSILQQVTSDVLDAINAPGEAPYPPDFVDQGVRGYTRMLRESLEGGSGEFRRAYAETAVPAAVASAGSAAKVVRDAALFTSLLGANLVCRVRAEVRSDAIAWWARFASDYLHDVAVAAFEAERELAG